MLGNGFFKPNISIFVSTLYKEGDIKEIEDLIYSIWELMSELQLAPFICGYIGQDTVNFGVNSWHYGFGLAGIGMVIGRYLFLYMD